MKLNPGDPIKIIFDKINWACIHPPIRERYELAPPGTDGYDPISLFKAQLLIYLGEVTPIESGAQRFGIMPVFAFSAALTSLKTLPMVLH